MGRRRAAWSRIVMAGALAAGMVVSSHGGRVHADDPPPESSEPRHFSLVLSGDVIPLPSLINRAKRNAGGTGYDFRPMLADIKPLVSNADLAICHLEIPVAPPGTKPTGHPRWSTPPEITTALADAGFDRCSLASNHALDKGVAGIDATLNAFDAAGLGHSGTARTPEEAVAEVFEVNGVRLVHLSYTFGFNGFRVPKDQPWRANRIDQARILADAADARARGAEFVVVSLHWGLEGRSRTTKDQRTLAQALTASGHIDLIVGHHAHVLQPIEQVNGRWVLYGLGNLMSNHRPETRWPAASEDGAVVRVEVTERAEGGFDVGTPLVRPTWSQPVTYAVYDALAHESDPSFTRTNQRRLARSLARTRKLLGAYFPTPAIVKS